MSKDLITVYLTREYGFDEWEWRTGMTEPALREFWEGIEEVWPYCSDIDSLPGELVPRKNRGEDRAGYGGKRFFEVWTAHIHINKDSVLHPPGPIEGRYERQVFHSRYKENEGGP